MNRRRAWSDAELALLRKHYARKSNAELLDLLPGRTVAGIGMRARKLGLRKSEATLRSKSGRFAKGMTTWNKGLPGSTGRHAHCRKTQFQPGNQPHNTLPLHTRKLDKDGLLIYKYSNRSGGSPSRRWRSVHSKVWEDAHGAIPPGHVVIFRRGMRTSVESQITADKLLLVSHARNMERNVHQADPRIKRLNQLKGAIARQINRIKKDTE